MIDLKWSSYGDRGRILIVDDARFIRHLIGHFVESIGYAAIHAENGYVAWQFVREYTPDLIITDIEMPILNGWQLIRQIRTSPDRRIQPIPIFVCSSITAQVRSANSLVQVEQVLDKPVNLKLLRDCLLALRGQ